MQTENNIQGSLFFTCEWFPSEQRLLLPPEDLSASEHAEKNRYVVKSSRPGPWRNENNPPLIGIMNASDRKGNFRNMRLEVVIKGVQTGVTEGAHNIILKGMDTSSQDILLAMESEAKIKHTIKNRFLPTIYRMPNLVEKLSANPDDITNASIKMANGLCLNTGWAGSQGSVSSGSYEKVILDEVDKFKVAMNLEEAKDRITAYPDTGLVFILSTPGEDGGPITIEFDGCDAHYDYHVQCPDCGCLQVMDFEHFWWPEKGEPKKTGEWKRLAGKVAREKLARYACNGCGSMWDDYARDKGVLLGLNHNFHGWKMREEIAFPVSVGFKYPSWISPFKSLTSVVARYLLSEEPELRSKRRAWHNQEAAEAYVEQQSERKTDTILALKDDRPRGIVPRGTAALGLIVDTQQRGFYYEVVAFGWGLSFDTWQVREGYVETFEGLKDVLYNSEYKDAAGRGYTIMAGAIDSGGGTGTTPKHTRTAEVYRFCIENPIMRPIKGRQMMTHPVSSTKIDFYPGTKIPISGGLTLFLLNVTYFKDQLSMKLSIKPDDPGAWHLHSECTEEYAKQMTVEYRDDKGRWQCPKGKANHYWDIGVYRLALGEILQVKFWKRPEENLPLRPAGRRVVNRGV